MKIKPFEEIGKDIAPITLTGNPLLDRIYQNRGITDTKQLDHSISNLLSPFLMKGMIEATDVLIRHIKKKSRILVVGDYDCDGATATTIAVEGLHMLGAQDVRFIVPDRQVHGYGLSRPVVQLASEYKPDLIVTVDNGIASIDGAKAVYELEHPCELLITDHHLAGDSIPHAEAIVNPNQPGCNFPSKSIAGCGVMLYVIIALRSRMRELGVLEELNLGKPPIEKLLDVAALGTVADVVTLDYNNRIIVSAGLDIMNRGKARVGINKLLEIGNREIGKIRASDMGFVVGPRLNAAGRLDDMTHGIRMLLETSESLAGEMAAFLNDMNNVRKDLQREMAKEAKDQLVDIPDHIKGIVLLNETWHEGLVGLIAGNVKETHNKPVICMTNTHSRSEALAKVESILDFDEKQIALAISHKTEIKGSARSIPGFHIKHALDKISKTTKGVLEKFGGHSMAAGLTIPYDKLPEFQEAFNKIACEELTDEMILGKCRVDIMDMPEEWINLNNAHLLTKAGPWGAGFEDPVFGGNFVIKDFTPMGKEKQHARVFIQQKGGDKIFEAVQWNCLEDGKPSFAVGNTVQCSFTLSINEYRGNTKVQVMIQHLQDEEFLLDLKKSAEFESENKISEDFSTKKMGIQKRVEARFQPETPGM